MKKKLPTILFGLLFVAGFGILIYPTVADQWNKYRQSQLISNYEEVVSQMTEENFDEEWAAARYYNQSFDKNSLLTDVFGIDHAEDIKDTEYWKVLNVAGDGVMGYVKIGRAHV